VPLGTSIAQRNLTGYGVSYIPGHDYIAYSMSSDYTVRTLDLNVDHAVQRICADTRGVLTEQLWNLHLSQLDYAPPCTN
jgi:hypothetical protein